MSLSLDALASGSWVGVGGLNLALDQAVRH